jgi:hypothetical protein
VKSLPVDRPANVAADDVLLAVVVTPSSTVLKAPNGWSLVRTDVSGTALRQSLDARRVAASEPGSYSWSVAGKHDMSIAVLAYRGADGSVLPVAAGSVTASSVSIPAASVQTTVGYLLVSSLRGTRHGLADRARDVRRPGPGAVPRAVSQQATTGVGASLSWRAL